MKLSKVSIIAVVPSLAYATLTHQEGERALKQDSIVRKPKGSRKKPKGSKYPKGSRNLKGSKDPKGSRKPKTGKNGKAAKKGAKGNKSTPPSLPMPKGAKSPKALSKCTKLKGMKKIPKMPKGATHPPEESNYAFIRVSLKGTSDCSQVQSFFEDNLCMDFNLLECNNTNIFSSFESKSVLLQVFDADAESLLKFIKNNEKTLNKLWMKKLNIDKGSKESKGGADVQLLSITDIFSTMIPSMEPSNLSPSLPGTLSSSEPSNLQSSLPSSLPSNLPSSLPISLPSSEPSDLPSSLPSSLPSFEPSNLPSSLPSSLPSFEASVNTLPLQFSTKSSHACAVYSSKVQCIGYNRYGQVSDLSPEDVTTPVLFTFPEENSASPIKVVTGERHTCVLMDDQSVWCKGLNNRGQLGNVTSSESSSIPVQVKNGDTVITNAIDIEAGSYHNCIKLDDNSLYCFGNGGYSQLGFNGETDLDVKLMALSFYVTCIVKHSTLNEVLCKGDSSRFNDKYPMGDGEEIVKLVSGDDHFCVLLKSKKAKCFGNNEDGQLGKGFGYDSFDSAVYVLESSPNGSPLSDITDINAGDDSTCLVVSNNTPMCFGYNIHIQLGIANGGGFNDVFVPTELTVILPNDRGDIASIHVGRDTGHVVYPDNSVFSWGYNGRGTLGDGPTFIGDTVGENAVEMDFDWN